MINKIEILNLLDEERQRISYPDSPRIFEENIVKDIHNDGKTCEIIYSNHSEEDIDEAIKRQISYALDNKCELEWKVYGHDSPSCLGDKLLSVGFKAEPKEKFMVLPLNSESLKDFKKSSCEIRKINDRKGLSDVRVIFEEVYKKNLGDLFNHYALMIEKYPSNMSIYVAYVNEEPASCGRVYFHSDSKFCGLYGGQTRKKFRNLGLFTSIVAVRMKEALKRKVVYASVDALPTSEPILRKRGFTIVTDTQPYVYDGMQ